MTAGLHDATQSTRTRTPTRMLSFMSEFGHEHNQKQCRALLIREACVSKEDVIGVEDSVFAGSKMVGGGLWEGATFPSAQIWGATLEIVPNLEMENPKYIDFCISDF